MPRPLAPIVFLPALVAIIAVACANDVGEQGAFAAAGDVAPEGEQAFSATCASGGTVKGIDVSYYQGTIDWRRVADDGVRYAFIRVSDGTGFIDSQFERNWREARRAGVLRGSYQFFRADEDPIRQANLLLDRMGPLQPGDLPPVLDVESNDGQGPSTVARRVRAWVDHVEARLGVKPIIYTGPYFWRDRVGGADFDAYQLWVAHYGTDCPLVPPTWTRWTFHQHTSSGTVRGISGRIDMNRFNGTMAQLRALTVGGDVPSACSSGNFRGAFCDDDRHDNEAAHDRLRRQLDVDFHCGELAGEPAFCPGKHATRAQTMFVLGAAADMPLHGHPDAFTDDQGHARERWLNAAHEYGILLGDQRRADPEGEVTRSGLALFLSRMYRLPPASRDWFDDDDGDAREPHHDRVAEAGLFVGYADAGGRRDFRPDVKVTRSTLAVIAGRAYDAGLVPVWDIPAPCLSGEFDGAYCDDDGSAAEARHQRFAAQGTTLFCDVMAGAPAFCGSREATRAEAVYFFLSAAEVSLAGRPDGFDDDDGHPHERWLDAAKALGVITGYQRGTESRPDEIASRTTLAVMLARLYQLPAADRDWFNDDDGDAGEPWHDMVGAAGLFAGYDDGRGGRAFRGDQPATREMLATVAARAADAGLTP